MTRPKRRVKLARIVNERKRKAALKRREKALIKSLNTICVLCGAEACMVICDRTNNTMAWPSKEQAEAMMSRFKSQPQEQREKNAVSHEMFLESLLVKENKKLESLRTKNNQMEMEEMLHNFVIDPTSIEPATGKLTRLFLYINDLIAKIEENESMSQSATNVNLV